MTDTRPAGASDQEATTIVSNLSSEDARVFTTPLNASDTPAASPEETADPTPVYFFPDKKTIVIGELVQLDDRASRTATISAMGRQWPRVRFGGTGRPETVDLAAHVGTYRLMEPE